MNNVKKALACGILFTFCAVLLAACGGGGNNPNPSVGSSNWDQMIWDTNTWG